MPKDLTQLLSEVEAAEPQERGKRFEEFLAHVFHRDGVKYNLSYRPRGEEIDGAISHGGRVLLLEAKWTKAPIPASEVYALRGKVEGKLNGTLGVFLSMSGYSKDCIDAVRHGKQLTMLLFDRADVEAFASSERFTTLLEEKLFYAGLTGEVYLSWGNLVQLGRSHRPKRAPDGQIVIVTEGPADAAAVEQVGARVFGSANRFKEVAVILHTDGRGWPWNVQMPSMARAFVEQSALRGAVVIIQDSLDQIGSAAQEHVEWLENALGSLPPGWATLVLLEAGGARTWVNHDGEVRRTASVRQLERFLGPVR